MKQFSQTGLRVVSTLRTFVSMSESREVHILTPRTEHLPAEAINWTEFVWQRLEVQLATGFVDGFNVAREAGENGPVEITPIATHRFVLSVDTFMRIYTEMQSVLMDMRAEGLPIPSSIWLPETQVESEEQA